MASNEEKAYDIMRYLDVDYIFVVFGGAVGYSSDDINKFPWMIRISGGVFHDIDEEEYLTKVRLMLFVQMMDTWQGQCMTNSLHH